jgi:hypothetical protein
MTLTVILIAVLFGLVGTGYVMYAKSAGELFPALFGVGLMVFPYFITNMWLMLIVGAALMVGPFLLRNYS